MKMQQKQMLIVPSGCVAIFTLVNDFKNEESCGHLLGYTIVDGTALKKLNDPVIKAICSFNDHHLKNKEDINSKHFKDLLADATNFLAS